jgi:hypothetical protein
MEKTQEKLWKHSELGTCGGYGGEVTWLGTEKFHLVTDFRQIKSVSTTKLNKILSHVASWIGMFGLWDVGGTDGRVLDRLHCNTVHTAAGTDAVPNPRRSISDRVKYS